MTDNLWLRRVVKVVSGPNIGRRGLVVEAGITLGTDGLSLEIREAFTHVLFLDFSGNLKTID